MRWEEKGNEKTWKHSTITSSIRLMWFYIITFMRFFLEKTRQEKKIISKWVSHAFFIPHTLSPLWSERARRWRLARILAHLKERIDDKVIAGRPQFRVPDEASGICDHFRISNFFRNWRKRKIKKCRNERKIKGGWNSKNSHRISHAVE